MPPEEINFQTLFAAKLKDRGVSIKKLSEATGIAPAHLVALMHGRFDDLPAAPYLRGYLARLGKALDFDGEEWWEKIKKERLVSNSGPTDALPSNRFIRQSPAKFIWGGVVAVLIIIYLAFQIPAVFAGPQLSVSFPTQTPYTTSSSTITLTGTVHGADSLSLDNGGGDTESVTIAPDGSWQKSVLLQDGPNTFQLVAKKLLGGSTQATEQIFYDGGPVATSSGTSTPTTASSTATSTSKSK
jgi:cytoskeletal protein RodZ